MKQKKNLNNKDVKVSSQDVEKWKKKLTVKSKNVLRICLIGGISLVVIGGAVGGHFIYNNIRLREEAKNKCTVTFETGEGATKINSAQINKGKQLQKPDNPLKEGFTLMSWCEDAELTKPVQFPLTINKSMTLYAKWSVAVFNVDFYLDASEITPYKSQTISYNKTVEVPPDIPEKPGYKFAGWFTNKQTHAETSRFFYGAGNLGTPITNNLSVYAKWVENTTDNAVVTYDFGKNQIYQYAAKVNELAPQEDYIKKPTYPGFNFIGWLKDFEKPDEVWDLSQTKVTEDVTLHAAWNQDGKNTVVFSYGDKKSFDVESVKTGECVKKPEDPKYPGYTFANWYDKDDKLFDFSTPIESNIVLHAKWNRCDWNVTEEQYKNSFKYLVDIEGVEKVTQDYIADGYCRRTIQKGQEEEIDFNVSRLVVSDNLEECMASGGVDKPYLYTKKQDNFYIYARTDTDHLGTFVGIKETNVRGQLAEVFASIYDAYPYFNIDQELKSFVYEYKDEEYDISSTIHFENKKIDQLHCYYSHKVGDVTTIYDIHFKYGYDQKPTISFPTDMSYKTEEEKHIHEFDGGHHSQRSIPANTTGDHILSVPSNTIKEAGLQYFRCFVPTSNGDPVNIDFITEDVTVYHNNKLLVKDTDYSFTTKDNVKVLYLTNPSVANDSYSVLLHQTKAVDKDVYIGFIKG